MNLGPLLDLHADLRARLACLRRSATRKLKSCRLVIHDHRAITIALEIAHWHLDRAEQRGGRRTARERETRDRARLRVERGVRAIAELGSLNGHHVHAGPDDAGVEVDAQALGSGGIIGTLRVVHRDNAFIYANGIARNEPVGLFDHPRHVGRRDHKANHAPAIGSEHGEVHLSQALRVTRSTVLARTLGLGWDAVDFYVLEILGAHYASAEASSASTPGATSTSTSTVGIEAAPAMASFRVSRS